MEELAILPILAAVAIAQALFFFVVDLIGWAMGRGWRYYSKKRAAKKAEEKRLKETFK